MLKAMPLRGLRFLAYGTLFSVGSIAVVVTLLVSGFFIIGSVWLLVSGVLGTAFGLWEIIPFVGSEIKIWDTTIIWGIIDLTIEGSLLWGPIDFIGGMFSGFMGWGIFHFLFPEEKKPKRLRRKRKAKKNPAPMAGYTL